MHKNHRIMRSWQYHCCQHCRIQRSVFFWGGGKVWWRGPNLPPFSSFSTDLGHFILRLLNFDIYFLFHVKFSSLFSRLGGAKRATLGLWGGGGENDPNCPPPLDPPVVVSDLSVICLSVFESAPPALTLSLHSVTRRETVPHSNRAIRKATSSELGTHSGQLQLTVRCRAGTAGRHVRAADQSLTQQFKGTGAGNQMANGGDVTLQDQLVHFTPSQFPEHGRHMLTRRPRPVTMRTPKFITFCRWCLWVELHPPHTVRQYHRCG